MPNLTGILKLTTAAARPAGRHPGELWVNFADKAFGYIDNTGAAVVVGGGGSLPANASGLLSNDGTGVLSWSDPTKDLITQKPKAGVSQSIEVSAPADVGLTLKAAAGQTAPLMAASDNAGTTFFQIGGPDHPTFPRRVVMNANNQDGSGFQITGMPATSTTNSLFLSYTDNRRLVLSRDNNGAHLSVYDDAYAQSMVSVYESFHKGTLLLNNDGGVQWSLVPASRAANASLSLLQGVNLKGTFAQANGAYTQASDTRLKNNQREIPYGLDEVLLLNPKQYEIGGETHIGLIAQNTLGVLPSVVRKLQTEAADGTEIDDPLLGIDYSEVVPVLIKAIQELSAKLDAAVAEIEALKSSA